MPVRHDDGSTVRLAQDQFDVICALLEPGFKLASAILAEREAANAEPKPPPSEAKKPQDDYTG